MSCALALSLSLSLSLSLYGLLQTILYTCVRYVPTPPLGGQPEDDAPCAAGHRGPECTERQLQCVAAPVPQADGSVDPLLRHWKKFAGNPVVAEAPPGGDTRQFRDPSGSWQLSNGATVTVVGGMVDGRGTAILYQLDDTMTVLLQQKNPPIEVFFRPID